MSPVLWGLQWDAFFSDVKSSYKRAKLDDFSYLTCDGTQLLQSLPELPGLASIKFIETKSNKMVKGLGRPGLSDAGIDCELKQQIDQCVIILWGNVLNWILCFTLAGSKKSVSVNPFRELLTDLISPHRWCDFLLDLFALCGSQKFQHFFFVACKLLCRRLSEIPPRYTTDWSDLASPAGLHEAPKQY